MPDVKFTYALKRFFPKLEPRKVDADNLEGILSELDKQYPGFRSYIVNEQGQLRQHVNIFLDGKLLRDRNSLSDNIDQVHEIHFMQALSGG